MELFIVIGNLGADAEVKTQDGNVYTKFNVAETRRWKAADGTTHDETIWNSCIMHGNQEKLLPFLTKGTKVCVVGRGSTRVFSSAKERRMVAGININVDRLELIGQTADPVPRQIIAPDGIVIETFKAFYIRTEDARKYAGQNLPATFYDTKGNPAFQVDYNGFVYKLKGAQTASPEQTEVTTVDTIEDAQLEEVESNDAENG